MSISEVRNGTGSQNGGGSTIVADFGTTPTEGNLLIAVVGSATSLSSLPTNWATAVSRDSRIYICWRIAGASEPTTATFTMGSSTQGVLVWAEYSSTTGWEASPVDVTVSTGNAGPDLSCSTGTTGTTAQDDTLAVAGFRVYGGVVTSGRSYTNSYVEVDDVIVEAGEAWSIEVALADIVLSSTGTTTSTLSWSSPSKEHRGALAVFLPVAAGSLEITPGVASQSVTAFAPTVAAGEVFVTPGVAQSLAAAYDPSVLMILRPASTIDDGGWDTGPTTGQSLSGYTSDGSDSTWIGDTPS